jgi:tetratricopeptide (TPR) repeat protein
MRKAVVMASAAVCLLLTAAAHEAGAMTAEDVLPLIGPDDLSSAAHQKDEEEAVRLCAQGSYSEAEVLFRQLLSGKERMFGADHPDMISVLDNFAWCFFKQRRHAQAAALFKRILAIEEHVLCKDYPGLANTLDSLAAVKVEQGRYAEAESLYRRALAVREKTLGKNHLDVATSLNNLAVLEHVLNRPADAAPLLRRALTILAEQLPAGHPKLKLYQKNYDELRKRLEKERRRLESG